MSSDRLLVQYYYTLRIALYIDTYNYTNSKLYNLMKDLQTAVTDTYLDVIKKLGKNFYDRS